MIMGCRVFLTLAHDDYTDFTSFWGLISCKIGIELLIACLYHQVPILVIFNDVKLMIRC